jgi:amino acid adenylation domain-containing protein
MNIAAIMASFAETQPDALAAVADGESLNYAQFAEQARRLGAWIVERQLARIAILGSRSLGAFVGVMGAAWAGSAYIPLSLKAPPGRLVEMLEQARPDVMLIDRHGALLVDDILAAAAPGLIVAADETTRSIVQPILGDIPTIAELQASLVPPAEVTPETTAYIIFTSGTTGAPKGVVVSVGARAALIDEMQRWYDLGPDDRIAETTDLSWDLSVANMIFAWCNGGSLHAVPVGAMVAPARFIRGNAISLWLSVPSVITTMMRTGQLRPAIFPSLRYSVFAGEGFSFGVAAAWKNAAPNSLVDNLYGPTEATFTCIGYRIGPRDAAVEGNVMIPIGRAYVTARAAIVGPDFSPLGAGQRGELVLGGPQLADGYLDRPDLTDARFPMIRGERWYLTGDAACCDDAGIFHHLGRLDNQLKVLGYRVELEDVESHVRAVSGAVSVAVIGWPLGKAAVESLIGFTVGSTVTGDEIRAALGDRLPAYMIPRVFFPVDAMPLSANGKLDRSRLASLLPDREVIHD